MEDVIGEAAGRIWHHLHTHGALSLPQLQQGTRLSERPCCTWAWAGWHAKESWCSRRSVGC